MDKLIDVERLTTLTTEFLPKLLGAVVTLLVLWLIFRLLLRGISHAMRRAEVDLTIVNFVESAARFVAGVIGLVAVLDQLGVDTASIIASLGVAGLTIGFAARDTLSNLIAGLFIFWDRPFVIGDLVEVDGRYGRVDKITLRSTRVVTPDGKMLAIPNTTVVNGTVASYTNFPHLRLDIDVTVSVNEDLGRARQVLLDICSEHPECMSEPAPEVVVTALNDYNVALQLRVWIDDEKKHINTRFTLREAMFEALRSAGVDMPYETLQLQPVEMKQVA